MSNLIHEEWVQWSKAVAKTVETEKGMEFSGLPFGLAVKIIRWQKYWVDYSQLPEHVKELDRVWARKILKQLESSGHVLFYQYSDRYCEEHDVQDCELCFSPKPLFAIESD